MRYARIGIILALLAGISVLHYTTPNSKSLLHVIYRELYLVPIILAAFWFGLLGGISSALLISLLYLPFIFWQNQALPGHNLGNLLQVLLFNLLGAGLGWLRNRDVKRQDELRQAQSLAAMGRAAASVAHDLKTPLITIGGFVSQVSRKMPSEDPGREKLAIVIEQIRRLENLVQEMLAFARPLDLQLSPDDLNQVVRRSLECACGEADCRGVTVRADLPAEPLIAPMEPLRLEQALVNLIINAVQASPPGAAVEVKARREGGSLVVEVKDDGGGIAAEIVARVCEPFFTTKKQGTGLGLPLVKKIVEAHQGRFSLESGPGAGTIARLILPAAPGQRG